MCLNLSDNILHMAIQSMSQQVDGEHLKVVGTLSFG